MKHDLRGLEGEENISFGSRDEWEDSPDAGGVSQCKEEGYMPRMEGGSSLDQSKGVLQTLTTTTRGEEQDVAQG
jgi:hypothetical protein